jgi:hypothetical protein
MNSSAKTTGQEPQDRSDHPRAKRGWKALLWLAVVAVAVTPYPWW